MLSGNIKSTYKDPIVIQSKNAKSIPPTNFQDFDSLADTNIPFLGTVSENAVINYSYILYKILKFT